MITQNPPSSQIKVLVVEDSLTVQQLLVGIVTGEPDMTVIGTARNGEEALSLAKRLHPDVVTMDVNMPVMDGLEATRYLMRDAPTRIIIVTSNVDRHDIDLSFEALRIGALAVVPKPGLSNPDSARQLVSAIRTMSKVNVVRIWFRGQRTGTLSPNVLAMAQLRSNPTSSRLRFVRVVGIAASTGGPAAVATVLSALTPRFPVPILLVHHITEGFSAGLVSWLSQQTPLKVKLAEDKEPARPGTVYLAPQGSHMQINTKGYLELVSEPPLRGHRPSADYLFHSMANSYDKASIGILLTGMGMDGAEGLDAMHRAGALTVAQDEDSCVVYGMPAAAVQRGCVDISLDPERIGQMLRSLEPA